MEHRLGRAKLHFKYTDIVYCLHPREYVQVILGPRGPVRLRMTAASCRTGPQNPSRGNRCCYIQAAGPPLKIPSDTEAHCRVGIVAFFTQLSTVALNCARPSLW